MSTRIELLRIAARRLLRARGSTVLSVLTLALGIGLSTAVFTVARAVLIRRLPVAEQDRVVLGWGATRDGRFANVPFTIDDIGTIERHSTVIADAAFFPFRGATTVPLRYEGRVFASQTALVSGNFFEVLGSQAMVGRSLRRGDDVPGAPPVAVLSDRAWRQQFGGDSSVIGRSITIVESGRSRTIVGVMPPDLDYPRGVDLWMPLVEYSTTAGFYEIVSREVDMLARLQPGASPRRAREEITRFFARPGASRLQQGAIGVVTPLSTEILGDTRPALIVTSLAAALLLLIACVNVANMVLMRALHRAKEVGVCAALGAPRGRIVREWALETSLMCLVAGVLGTALSVVAVRGFVLIAGRTSPVIADVVITPGTFGIAAVATFVALALTAVPPATFAARVDVGSVLQSGTRSTLSPRLQKVLQGLVVAQLALAVIGLSAAGLVMNSFARLMRADLSFEVNGLLVAPLSVTASALPSADRTWSAIDGVRRRLREIPGIDAVAVSFSPPFIGGGGGIDGQLSTPDQTPEQQRRNPILNQDLVGPDYFTTVGIPLLHGRAFTAADREGTAPVVVVSSAVANHFWPGQDPLGKRLRAPAGDVTVIGVVPEARFRDLRAARPSVYFPAAQAPFGPFVPTTMLIRSRLPAAALLPALRRAVNEESHALSVVSLASVESMLDGPRAGARLNAIVLTFFAGAALFLASLGIFAIMATMVRRRTHEFGIRMALGATPRDVWRLVLRQSVVLASLGAVCGVLAAIAMNRSFESLLFQVSSTDAATLGAVAALTVVVAVLSTFAPARASARVEPAVALKSR